MQDLDALRELCHDADGNVRPHADCRATLINHLIIESDSFDIDVVEQEVDKAMKELKLWPEEDVAEENK